LKILVTGGAGFIGRWVVGTLLKKFEVVVLDNFSNSTLKNVQEFSDSRKFKLIQGDILEEKKLEKSFENVGLCMHLAAKVNVQESLENPENFFQNNVVGTYNVLEACRRNDTPLIFCGTCLVYDLATSEPINEKHKVNPKSPYAGSKAAAEELAISYYHGYSLPLTIVRAFNTYGPYQKSDLEGGVVNIFIRRYLQGKDLLIFGDGKQTRDLLYVEDCADFFNCLIEKTKGKGEIINAGTGKDIEINKLASMICEDPTRIKHIPHHHPQSEIYKLVCDNSKAKEILNWRPKTSLEAGIKKTMSWMKS
jgi:UDP-glucose 4-epimerase